MDIIKECVNELRKGELFVSEMDFQFYLALKLKEKGAQNIILNYPIRTCELYKNYNNKHNHYINSINNKHIDLYFTYADKTYFLELKYKTDVYCVKNCHLIKQLAYPDNFYSIYKDIERMENLKTLDTDRYKTYVLCLTNDSYYWQRHLRGKVANYTLEDNEKIGPINNKDLYLKNKYNIKWEDFKDRFKYLLIEI